MNASSVELPGASKEFICDVVDNDCALNLSEHPAIVVVAYCAVFLPWGFLALFDMINERWKPLKDVFAQAGFQLAIAPPSIAYTMYYIHLQRIDRDYKEMCAAIVAVCLSAFHFIRTFWGLCQAYVYWKWVKRSLKCLIQHGYRLPKAFEDADMDDTEENIDEELTLLSLSMKVNESMIDNEFHECDVPFEFNWARLLHPRQWFSSKEQRKPWLAPKHEVDSAIRCIIPFLAQFGTDWIKDSSHAKAIVEDESIIFFNSEKHFFYEKPVKVAQILTERGLQIEANFYKTWSNVLKYQANNRRWPYSWQDGFRFENGPPLPFGCKSHYFRIESTYESRIQRLVGSLPVELFENRENAKVIQAISAFHLESFVLFLDSKVHETVGSRQKRGSLLRCIFTYIAREILSKLQLVFNVLTPRERSRTNASTSSFDYQVGGIWGREVFEEVSGRDSNTDANVNGSSEEGVQTEVEISGDFSSEEYRRDLNTSGANSSTYSSEEREENGGILENEAALHGVCGSHSNSDATMTGNGAATLQAEMQSWTYLTLDTWECANVNFWDGRRIENEKFGGYEMRETSDNNVRAGHTRFEFVSYSGHFDWAGPRLEKFTVHLENIFAVSNMRRSLIDIQQLFLRTASDREAYYRELCSDKRTIRRLSIDDKMTPRCAAQRSYWKYWRLPKNMPPALRDADHAAAGTRGSIKFIGYIMETVRVCLAKWCEKHVTDDMDKGIWSPVVQTNHAMVQFEASKDALNWTLGVGNGKALWLRILWECQNHLMRLIENGIREDNGVRPYGPSDVAVMMLCMLGSPALRITIIRSCFEIEPLPDWEFKIRITLTEANERAKHGIRMSIIPFGEYSSFKFYWAKWIHNFEACMKVLRYEYGEDDLQPVAASSASRNSSGDDVGEMEEKDNGMGEADDGSGQDGDEDGESVSAPSTSTNSSGDDVGEMEQTDNGMGEADDGSGQEGEDDGESVSAECSCGCRYRLNTKARRVFVKDWHGERKYYWEWDGWKPQPAFEKGRFPLLHDEPTPEAGTPVPSTTSSVEDVEASVTEIERLGFSLRGFLRRCAEGGSSNSSRVAGEHAV